MPYAVPTEAPTPCRSLYDALRLCAERGGTVTTDTGEPIHHPVGSPAEPSGMSYGEACHRYGLPRQVFDRHRRRALARASRF